MSAVCAYNANHLTTTISLRPTRSIYISMQAHYYLSIHIQPCIVTFLCVGPFSHACVHTLVFLHLYTHSYLYFIHIFVIIYLCTHSYLYIYTYICIRIFMHVFILTHIHTHICTHTLDIICIHTHAHIWIYSNTHTQNTHTHKYTSTLIQIHIYTQIHINSHISIRTYNMYLLTEPDIRSCCWRPGFLVGQHYTVAMSVHWLKSVPILIWP